MNGRSLRPGLWAGLLLITGLAYAPALRGHFLWDDDTHLTRNNTLGSIQGLGAIWRDPGAVQQYYPLTYTAFWLEHRLWGFHATGYHTVNVLLQATNAWTFGRLLLQLELPGAWLSAAVFALHPVNTESVAWISE